MTKRQFVVESEPSCEIRVFTRERAVSSTLPPELQEWLDSARIEPVSARSWTCRPQWGIVARQVPDAMWFWIERGSGRAWVGEPERWERVGPGDIVMVPQGMRHGIEHDPGQEFSLVTVHFLARLLGGQDLLELLGLAGRFSGEPGAPYGAVSINLAEEWGWREPGWRQAHSAGIWSVLIYILRHHDHRLKPLAPAKQRILQRLQPAFEVMMNRLGDPELSVSQMATAVHVSEVYLRKMFRTVMGDAPLACLRKRRIEKAAHLLRTTDVPLKQVAVVCGYSSLQFFHRAFRAATGNTPGEYRGVASGNV